jgi:bifunctional DNase/RNase
MTEMTIRGVAPSREGDEAILMLETVPAGRCLGLVVPLEEARRLRRALARTACQCSPAHDLLLALAGQVEARIERAVLDACPDGISACLVFGRAGAELEIPCHPADAVALAVRSKATIYGTAAALRHACPSDAHLHAAATDEVTAWLDRVRPADFTGAAES